MERRVLKYFLLLSLLAPLTLAAQRPAKGRKTVVQQPAPVSYDSPVSYTHLTLPTIA